MLLTVTFLHLCFCFIARSDYRTWLIVNRRLITQPKYNNNNIIKIIVVIRHEPTSLRSVRAQVSSCATTPSSAAWYARRAEPRRVALESSSSLRRKMASLCRHCSTRTAGTIRYDRRV